MKPPVFPEALSNLKLATIIPMERKIGLSTQKHKKQIAMINIGKEISMGTGSVNGVGKLKFQVKLSIMFSGVKGIILKYWRRR